MKQEHIDQFEREQTLGNRAKQSYDQFIKDFVETKRLALFNTFCGLHLTDETGLMEVKRMSYAIDTLESEILTLIETGKMASITLNANEEGVKH